MSIDTRLARLEVPAARPRRVLVAWQDAGDPQPDQYRLDDVTMTRAQIRAHIAQAYPSDDVTLILVDYGQWGDRFNAIPT